MTTNPQTPVFDCDEVERELEEKVISITGSCHCSDDYTRRKLKDPHCDYHNFAPEIKEVLAAAVGRIKCLEGERDFYLGKCHEYLDKLNLLLDEKEKLIKEKYNELKSSGKE